LKDKIIFQKEMEAGSGFGELALLYNDKRTATVRSKEPCKCWAMEGRVFKNIVIK